MPPVRRPMRGLGGQRRVAKNYAMMRQQQGMTATQFMLMTVILASAFILLNVYHLMPKEGMNSPLPRGTSSTDSVAMTTADNTQQQAAKRQQRVSTTVRKDLPQQPQAQQNSGDSSVEYHIIFSTGCSPKQNFQSYIFFFHAMKSGQPGTVTRIAACANDDDKYLLMNHFKEYIIPMSPNFKLHITPDYSGVKPGHSFHYFNKPFSTHHWMEHALGFGGVGSNPHDDAIVILCDPDQIIMRPFVNNLFFNETEDWMKRTTHPIVNSVTHGKPMGQLYGFATQWKTKTNITRYVPKEELPSFIQTMSDKEAHENYAVGPPYIATARDFYQIVTRWKDFVALVHDDYPYLLAEMFAYCLAAAHLKLPHQVAKSFMVSDVSAFGLEGWNLLDKYSKADVCVPGRVPTEELPHILHYCQRYLLGKFVIGKHRIPETFLSCEDPLLMEAPHDIGVKFDFAIDPDSRHDERLDINKHTVKNHAFMLCHLIPYLNQAATYWKDNHCEGRTPNKEKSLSFFKNMEVDPKFFEK